MAAARRRSLSRHIAQRTWDSDSIAPRSCYQPDECSECPTTRARSTGESHDTVIYNILTKYLIWSTGRSRDQGYLFIKYSLCVNIQMTLPGKPQVRQVQQVKSDIYLLDDFLTGVSLSVLYNGVCVSEGKQKVSTVSVFVHLNKVWIKFDYRQTSRWTHLKITASLSSQTVGSADLPFVDSSAKSCNDRNMKSAFSLCFYSVSVHFIVNSETVKTVTVFLQTNKQKQTVKTVTVFL